MPNGIDAGLKPVQLSGGRARSDGSRGEAQPCQLTLRDDPVLARRKGRDLPIHPPSGEFRYLTLRYSPLGGHAVEGGGPGATRGAERVERLRRLRRGGG